MVEQLACCKEAVDACLTVDVAEAECLTFALALVYAKAEVVATYYDVVRLQGISHHHILTDGITARWGAVVAGLCIVLIEQYAVARLTAVEDVLRYAHITTQEFVVAIQVFGGVGNVDAVHVAAGKVYALVAKVPYGVNLVDDAYACYFLLCAC